MAYLCGCYYRLPPNGQYYDWSKKYLPLLGSEVRATILSTTSRTVLKQTFTNPSSTDAIKECVYTFPLYDGVSVVDFTCQIGSKILQGVVKEKVEAEAVFDAAVARGETAGLLEQAPEASDVFSTKLGNIPASESVIVEVTYIGELKNESDSIRFTIPTKIAPRYGNASTALARPNRVDDGEGIKITVDVSVPEGSSIENLQSPSHTISVLVGKLSTALDAAQSFSKSSATLSLGGTALEKDFVLIVKGKDFGKPRALLETHPTIAHHRALMVNLVPKFKLPPANSEIVLVADRSGSMTGNIEMLVSALQIFLKSMPLGVKFNICSFGNESKFLWRKSKTYSKEAVDEAMSHLQSFGADMGGTETQGAIKATISQRFPDLPLEIILLTDGDVWGQEEMFAYLNQQVTESKGNIRVFPLGIGSGVSHALINGIARAGNGFSQAVQNGERLDSAVVRMLRGALTPHINDYTLEVKYEPNDDGFEIIEKVIDGMKVLLSEPEAPKKSEKKTISLLDADLEDKMEIDQPESNLPNLPTPKLLQAPHTIPTLYAFSGMVVYLLMSPDTYQRNPTSVILRATSAHGPLELSLPVEVLSKPGKTVHQLAAKKAVQDLEEGRGWIYEAKDQDGDLMKEKYPSRFEDMVKAEAVKLGETFQIAGKWCSFVAVSKNGQEEDINPNCKFTEAFSESSSYYSDSDEELFNSKAATYPRYESSVVRNKGGQRVYDEQPRKKQSATRNRSIIDKKVQVQHQEQQSPFSCAARRAMTIGHRRSPSRSPENISLPQELMIPEHQIKKRMMKPASVATSPSGSLASALSTRRGFGALHQQQQQQGGYSTLHSPLFSMSAETKPSAYYNSSEISPAPPQTQRKMMTNSGAILMGGSAGPPRADKVHAVINLQSFEGFWEDLHSSLYGTAYFDFIDELDVMLQGKKNVLEKRALTTLMVVLWLELAMSADKDTWELVVEKARAWLETNMGKEELEELEESVRDVVVESRAR
ncbi:hypothetical protein B7494_g3537 [Chlorociboria aeruginascens]|nr:hypothetical protein B7494_g3537 [Chlorociboria aeruginascens]